MELVKKKKLLSTVSNLKDMTFIIYIASFGSNSNIHLLCRAQLVFFCIDKTSIIISSKYSNFTDIFTLELATKLSKYNEIIDHSIDLVNI